jgi:NADH:ubiquinone oxidoreductase subunit K
MTPFDHVLLLGLLQFVVGLVGLLLRRSGLVVLVSAMVMLSGILLVFGAQGMPGASGGAQASGVVVLVLMVALLVVGTAVLYSFDRFRRTLNVEDHDRMKR